MSRVLSQRSFPETEGGVAMLSAAQVAERLGLPISKLKAMQTRKGFPRRLQVGRCVRYLARDVDAYLARLARDEARQRRFSERWRELMLREAEAATLDKAAIAAAQPRQFHPDDPNRLP